MGHDYDRGWTVGNGYDDTVWDWTANFCGIAHWEEAQDRFHCSKRIGDHWFTNYKYRDKYWGYIVPALISDPGGTHHPWTFGVDLLLLCFDLRLGFNPWFWGSDEEKGGQDPDVDA